MLHLLFSCVIIFSILIISHHFFKERALITIGIGSAIGANFYNANAFPFSVLGYRLSLDTCLFSLFIFCVVLSFVNHGKKSAITLLLTVICAIMFTAVLEFLAILSSTEILTNAALKFVYFTVNVLAFFISGMLCITVADKLKNTLPKIINIIIFILLSNIIKLTVDTIYASILGNSVNIIASIIGIAVSLVFSIIAYIIMKMNSLKKSEPQIVVNAIK